MNLKPTITSVVGTHPTPGAVRDLIELFHRIAIVYLSKKVHTGSLDPDFFGMRIEDIALDCIAELFQKDSVGRFDDLCRYYETIEYDGLDDDQLLAFSRRLVFSSVNCDLFRQYHLLDPSLHRIIRNIKTAAGTSDMVTIQCKNDEWWILFVDEDDASHARPIMPVEFLESYLVTFIAQTNNVKSVLAAVGQLLKEQTTYRRAYPLFGLARALKSAYARLDQTVTFSAESPFVLRPEEIHTFIESSVAELKSSMHSTYVGKGKMTEELFLTYCAVVKDILRADYIEQDHQDKSFSDFLRAHIGEFPNQVYKEEHRIYLENLAKIGRRLFLDRVRKEL